MFKIRLYASGMLVKEKNELTFDRIVKYVEEYADYLKSDTCYEIAKKVKELAQDYAPYFTGRLERGIVARRTKDGATVYTRGVVNPKTGFDYAYIQEVGYIPHRYPKVKKYMIFWGNPHTDYGGRVYVKTEVKSIRASRYLSYALEDVSRYYLKDIIINTLGKLYLK